MTSLLDVLESLARDPLAKADYASDPGTFLHRQGFGDLAPEDISEALAHAANSFPPVLAAIINPFEGLQSVASVVLDHLGMTDIDDFSVVPAELLALQLSDDTSTDSSEHDQAPEHQVQADIPDETALDEPEASFDDDTDELDAPDDAPDAGLSESAQLDRPDLTRSDPAGPDLDEPAQLPSEAAPALAGAGSSLDSFDLLGDPDADMFGSDLSEEIQADSWGVSDHPLDDLDPMTDVGDTADFDDLDA